jgi:NAD-dependent DNA ligase
MDKNELLSKFQNILTPEQLSEVELYFDASEAYYGGPEDVLMSDSEFDELSEKLLSYNIPDLSKMINESIFKNDHGLEPVTEQTQEMISLNKQKYKDRSSVVDIIKFFPDRSKPMFYSPKFDGAALKIIWDFTSNSIPVIKQILTRGGLDVTTLFSDNVDVLRTKKYHKNIITGELVIAKKTFNEKYSTEVGGDYENARNFVGSLVKQKSISENIKRDLNFIQCTDGVNPLENKNIWSLCAKDTLYNLENIIAFYKSEDFEFLCDGIVIAQIEEGERKIKDNYPMNMLAVKFPASRAKTKVIAFTWSQRKSGKLTPKCIIEPVKLDGSTCTKANGYNYQNLIDKHIGIGSLIEIEKSGDIIPVVMKVLTRSNEITFPDCDYKHIGKHLIALDMEESRRYKFVLGLRLLQLDGIGETLAEKIGDVVDYQILDLFNKTKKPLICDILGGGVNWQKFSKIYDIKTLHLDTLIALLQFNGVGPKISKKIALILTKKSVDTSNISGDILMNVCKGEGFQRINDGIKYLKIHGINILAPIEINDETITFEMTQEPPGMTKGQFEKKIQETYPNAIHTTLTRETKYLFCTDSSANMGKLNKARKYNVKIVTYTDALNGKL